MKIIHNNLSVHDMEEMVRIRETIREGCRLDALGNQELAELLRGLEQPFASLIAVLGGRRARLAKIMAAIERERAAVGRSVDPASLSAVGTVEKMQRLEKLINDYCYLNEGLGRTRGGRRPSRTKVKKGGRKER